MERIRFLTTFYNGGHPEFVAGQEYPFRPEMEHHIILGRAEIVAIEPLKAAESAKTESVSDAPTAEAPKKTLSLKGKP